MRIAYLLGVLAALVAVNGQNVRELTVYDSDTTINDFHLEAGETLEIIFMVDPHSLAFYYSTLFRIPTGTFSRDTLRVFEAYSSSINTLTEDDFYNAVSLEELYLGSNAITTLPANLFRSAPRLRYINLSFCGITSIDATTFAGLENLEYLSLYYNNIATIPANSFMSLYNMHTIDLGGNAITNVDFANFSNHSLRTLWLENNEIETIVEGDIVSSNLLNLNIFGNKIEKLENYAFRQLPQLENLHIGSNSMTEIEENAFVGLDNLLSLNMYNNEISTLPSGVFLPLRQVTYMDMGYNQISNINFRLFSNQANLEALWMEHNELEAIDIRTFVSLRSLYELYVYSNGMETLDLSDVGFLIPRLSYIHIGFNEFSCREVAQILTNLRKFNIYLYPSYEYDTEKIVIDGIGCYEYDPIEPIKKKLSVNEKKVLQAKDDLHKLKRNGPAKEVHLHAAAKKE